MVSAAVSMLLRVSVYVTWGICTIRALLDLAMYKASILRHKTRCSYARSIAQKIIGAVTCCFPHFVRHSAITLVMCVSAAYPCLLHIASLGPARDSWRRTPAYHFPAFLRSPSALRCRWSSASHCYPRSMRFSFLLAESHPCFPSDQKLQARLFLGQGPARSV